MTRFTRFVSLSIAAFGSLALLGCATGPARPAEFGGGVWQKVCTHSSMTEAAYREAFDCHRAAKKAALARLERLRSAGTRLALREQAKLGAPLP